jgi:hypothetical protein
VFFTTCSIWARQHARQHGPLDAELLVVEIDRLVVGGRTLHGEVQAQLRMLRPGVFHQAGVGEDDGIHAEIGRLVDGGGPAIPGGRLRIGVECNEHLRAAGMGVTNAFAQLGVVEIQPGEIARVGVVLEAGVDAVGAVVHGGFQRRQGAGRADEFEGFAGEHGREDLRRVRSLGGDSAGWLDVDQS